MALHSVPSLFPRDPANELYDRACDLIDAAQQLRRALDRPGHEPALNATLGCIQATLVELTAAFDGLRQPSRPEDEVAQRTNGGLEPLRNDEGPA